MKRAFTMAEILLSLTIIGIVAAITLPSLTGNINERTWNTQRKALYARFSQAMALLPALNGYGTLTPESGSGTASYVAAEDTAAESFVTTGLAKVIKINNICTNDFKDCGIPETITTIGATTIDFPTDMKTLNLGMVGSASNTKDKMNVQNTKAVAFETQNGESIVAFYYPKCLGSLHELPLGGDGGYFIAPKICANFIYDLNGSKGPNTVGKDIGFMTAMFPSDPQFVAPYPAIRKLPEQYAYDPKESTVGASVACTNFDPEYRLPNVYEAMSMFVNRKLIGDAFVGRFATSEIISEYPKSIWFLSIGSDTAKGQIDDHGREVDHDVWCVQR